MAGSELGSYAWAGILVHASISILERWRQENPEGIKLRSEFKTNSDYRRLCINNKIKPNKQTKESFFKAKSRGHRLLK